MDLVRTEPEPRSVAYASRGEDLRRILRPEVNVCVWRRELPASLARRLDAIARAMEHEVAHHVTPGAVGPLFEGLPRLDAWEEDVAVLVRIFCGLVGKSSARASLATVATNKCRKFHTDYKTVRLVCTYAGPGTEWVSNASADRSALGHHDACIDTANARIVRRGSSIRRANAGDVVLLKGELFEGNRGRGAVHRSPPIEATGERRLVLTLDAS